MGLVDPNLALIMSALAAVTKDTVSEAVKDAYHALRDRIKQKSKGKPATEIALAEYEKKPEVWEAPLRAELIELDAPHDPEIIQAAQELLSRLQPNQIAANQFNNQFMEGVQGVVQGNQANVTMNFGEKQPEK